MSRFAARSIPSAFIRLDSDVSAAGRFVNVRDLQVAASNHNIALAQGMRRVVLAHSAANYQAADPLNAIGVWGYVPVGLYGDGGADAAILPAVIDAPVMLSQGTKAVTAQIYGALGVASRTVKAYLVVTSANRRGEILTSASGTFSSTTAAFVNITATLPPQWQAVRGMGRFRLQLFVMPDLGANRLGGSVAITAVTTSAYGDVRPSVDIAVGSEPSPAPGVGDIIKLSTDSVTYTIVRRQVPGDVRYTLSRAWPGDAPTTSDTVDVIANGGYLRVESVTVYEDYVTGFDDEVPVTWGEG